MAIGFSDLDESYDASSESYDENCSLLCSSDDEEYAEMSSQEYDADCSLLG